MKKFNTYAQMYKAMLADVQYNPDYVTAPRGLKIKEKVNTCYVLMNPYSTLFENEQRGIPSRYLAGELDWYFSGSNKLEEILPYSKFWGKIANDDQTVNSAYGHLLFKKLNIHGKTQWNWAYNQIANDQNTRQAIMYFGGPDYQFDGNKDFVCTSYGMFQIRDGKLNFHVYMRSNDLIKGTTFDVPFFLMLQQNMLLLLQEVYPELEIGYYYHNATSLHIYENDFDLVDKMLNTRWSDAALPQMEIPLVDKDGKFTVTDQPICKWINTNK